MANKTLNDEEVEQEIQRLQQSPHVKLARQERRLRERRRMDLYALRQEEKKGKALEEAGLTAEKLKELYVASDPAEIGNWE